MKKPVIILLSVLLVLISAYGAAAIDDLTIRENMTIYARFESIANSGTLVNEAAGYANGTYTSGAGTSSNGTGKLGAGFKGAANQYGSISDSTDIECGSKCSVAFWFNDTQCTTPFGRLYNKDQAYQAYADNTANKLNFEFNAGAWTSADITLSCNTWHFMVITYDATTTRIYKDGSPIINDTSFTSAITNNANALLLGNGGTTSSQYARGILDEFMFYKNRILTQADISYLYNSGAGRIVGTTAAINQLTYSSISASKTQTTADISVTWNVPANVTVNYGTTTALGSTAVNATKATSVTVFLSGLTANTTYFYNVTGTNGSLTNASGPYNFTTSPIAYPALLTRFPTTQYAAQEWTASGPLMLVYTNNATGAIYFNGSVPGYVTDDINTTAGDWTGKVLNMTFIYEDTGVAMGVGQGLAIGMGTDPTQIHSPSESVDFTINSCNGGDVYMLGSQPDCGKAVKSRSTGNHTINLVWDTTTNTNNVRLYIDGELNPVNGTQNRSLTPGNKPNSVYLTMGASQPAHSFHVFNVSICENYCPAIIPSLTLRVNDTRTGSYVSGFTYEITNGTITETGYCPGNSCQLSSINVTGGTVSYTNISGATYYNTSVTGITFTSGGSSVTATGQTYQSIMILGATQAFTGASIANFTMTSGSVTNTTTSGSLRLVGSNETNNVMVQVLGNYTINFTCQGGNAAIVNCNATGIYDDKYNITAINGLTGANVSNFSVTATSSVGSTTNVSSGNITQLWLLRGYNWTFTIDAPTYAISNATLAANASAQTYRFNLSPTNSIYIYVYDEDTQALLNNVNTTVTLQNGVLYYNTTNTTGRYLYTNLTSGTWTVTVSSSGYTSRTYFLTVTDRSTQTLNAYLSLTSVSVIFTNKDSVTGNAISGGTFTVQRLVGPNYVTVGQTTTDTFGQAVFQLQPLKEYQFIFSATGYFTKTGIINTVITTYTVLINANNTQQFTSYLDDFTYKIAPNSVTANTTVFSITTDSPNGVLQYFGLTVTYNGTSQTQNVTGSPSGGTASIMLDLSNITGTKEVTATYFAKSVNLNAPLTIGRSWAVYGGYASGNYTFVDFATFYGGPSSPLGTTTRGIIVTITAVLLAAGATLMLGGSVGIIVAAGVFIVAGAFGWLSVGLTIVVVTTLIGLLVMGGRQ